DPVPRTGAVDVRPAASVHLRHDRPAGLAPGTGGAVVLRSRRVRRLLEGTTCGTCSVEVPVARHAARSRVPRVAGGRRSGRRLVRDRL
ncbi:MAG: hypothetical protein AVDCRST_MAG72-1984, partial [uncultured Nocardioidaceae bacterium]